MYFKIEARNITSKLLDNLLGIKSKNLLFSDFGDVSATHSDNVLSYIKDEKYIEQLLSNNNIKGVICTEEVKNKLPEKIIKVVHKDPNFAYFTLVDYFGDKFLKNEQSVILTKNIGHGSVISDVGVYIGRDVVIEPNVTILKGSIIEDNVVIRAGAVIGLDTFQHQRTTQGIISPKHDGLIHILDNVEIGANSCLSRGFSYRNTIIGNNSKLDAHVYVAHGANIGDSVIICAGAKVMGHTLIGDGVFLGPSSVISSRVIIESKAKVSIGSVVTKNIAFGQHMTGNFAIPHDSFMKNLKLISQ